MSAAEVGVAASSSRIASVCLIFWLSGGELLTGRCRFKDQTKRGRLVPRRFLLGRSTLVLVAALRAQGQILDTIRWSANMGQRGICVFVARSDCCDPPPPH